MMWIWVDLPDRPPYPCFGIKVTAEKVVDAAPIARWMIGKDVVSIKRWIERSGGRYICLTPDENA
jgi:hypothetical protein